MNIETVNEIAFKFGDYAIIEQKRHGVPNEMFVHKVVDQLSSNSWVDVPVQSPATETLHDEMEDVCWCICCGVNETEVRKYRVKDMQSSSLSPDGSELTAALATIEKCREIVGCPAGVDLQDHLRQLAAENAGLKALIPENWNMHDALHQLMMARPGGVYFNKWEKLIVGVLNETTATDRIVAEAEARGIEKGIAHLEKKFSNIGVQIMNLQWLADSLREGVK